MTLNSENIDKFIPEAERVLLPGGGTFDEASREFIKCLDTRDVVACPGSGKTTALLAKLYILSKFMPFDNNQGICVLTHTNVAINEIKERMGKQSSVLFSYPNFFGTIQSFVDKFLAVPYYCNWKNKRIVKIDNALYYKYIENQRMYLGKEVNNWCYSSGRNNYPNSLRYCICDFSIGGDLYGKDLCIDTTRFDEAKIMNNISRMKRVIMDNGVLSFDDAYSLAYTFLRKYPLHNTALSKRFSFVFIDEMQDTAQYQIDLLEKVFSESVIIQRIGDPNQAIYSNINRSGDWKVETNPIKIYTSKRFSQNIAGSIKYVCKTPEDKLKGSEFISGITPKLILFDEPSEVLEKFAELINENKNEWKDVKKPVYKAVSWVAKDKDTLTLRDYFSDFNDPKKTGKTVFNSLKNYLVKPVGRKDTKPIYDALINCFLAILDIAEVKQELNKRKYGRRFTKKSLLKHFEDNHPDFLVNFLEKLAEWTKKIHSHCCNTECEHSKKFYPVCIVNQVIKFIEVDFSGVFDIKVSKISDFLNAELEEFKNEVKNTNNKFTRKEINIKVGKIHSVKGETHTATLLMETYYKKFESQRLLDFMKGRHDQKKANRNDMSKSLKMAYVAMSRPTHLLCVAFKKDRVNIEHYSELENNGWEIVEI